MAIGSVQSDSQRTTVEQSTRDLILDIGTSNADAMELLMRKFDRDDLTPAQQLELQSLFSERQQKISLISNMLRTLSDAMMNIVRNYRG